MLIKTLPLYKRQRQYYLKNSLNIKMQLKAILIKEVPCLTFIIYVEQFPIIKSSNFND